MNNKLIVVIIFAIIVLGIGGYLIINKNSKSENNDLNNQNSSPNENIPEDNSDKEGGSNVEEKVLVLYFSQSGNTEKVANFIHEEVGGDIIKLETVTTYPSDYDELVDYAQEEQRADVRPELKTTINNMDEYDTIFLGYPNWWGDMPMPLYTFLDNYDLSGKTIAPFITHGGSGLSETPNKIQQVEKEATVTEGLAISGSSAGNSKATVNNWLNKLGF